MVGVRAGRSAANPLSCGMIPILGRTARRSVWLLPKTRTVPADAVRWALDDLDRRGLARPVGAEEGVKLPALDLELEVSDGVEFAVPDVQLVDFDDGSG